MGQGLRRLAIRQTCAQHSIYRATGLTLRTRLTQRALLSTGPVSDTIREEAQKEQRVDHLGDTAGVGVEEQLAGWRATFRRPRRQFETTRRGERFSSVLPYDCAPSDMVLNLPVIEQSSAMFGARAPPKPRSC